MKASLKDHSNVSVDWKGTLLYGITLDWDYKMRHVDLSVPSYVDRKLVKYQHPHHKKPQHFPHQSAPIVYGTKVQQPTPSENIAPLTDNHIKRVQNIFGMFICYVCVYDPTLAAGLSTINLRQTKSTEAVLVACHQLLYCLTTYHNATLQYHASDMSIVFDTDGSYLS